MTTAKFPLPVEIKHPERLALHISNATPVGPDESSSWCWSIVGVLGTLGIACLVALAYGAVS